MRTSSRRRLRPADEWSRRVGTADRAEAFAGARCPPYSFTDRFLVVRGEKRTYKIHLGSGNILMEPNDEYLCIVPDSRSREGPGGLFLPFEGDGTLSIIISKALLLADDARIKDPTITRQIDRR